MQNKYVGDYGDYGKYGLLRALCGFRDADEIPELALGIVWYLNDNDDKQGGGLDEYLNKSDRYRRCDPSLFDALKKIRFDARGELREDRNVEDVQNSGIFPSDTRYHSVKVPRLSEERQEWLVHAMEETHGSEVVFVDPDIGVAAPSIDDNRNPQYVYYDELAQFLRAGKSLVVYQQLSRFVPGSFDRQAETKLRKLNGYLHSLSPFLLRFPQRAFFVIPKDEEHRQILLSRAEQLSQGAWSGHFSLVDPESP